MKMKGAFHFPLKKEAPGFGGSHTGGYVMQMNMTMKIMLGFSVVLIFFFSGIISSTGANANEPVPTIYPRWFRVHIMTNLSRPFASEEISSALQSTMYYNWDIRAQRVDHPPGAYECFRFYNTSAIQGCSLYFLSRGLYRVVQGEESSCCLDLPGIGAPPRDWALQANATYVGRVRDEFTGLDAFEWSFKSDKGHHGFREAANSSAAEELKIIGAPLLFTFPGKARGLQDYHFVPNSWSVKPQNSDLFDLPSDCETALCSEQHYTSSPLLVSSS